jgi:hypothetical protein
MRATYMGVPSEPQLDYPIISGHPFRWWAVVSRPKLGFIRPLRRSTVKTDVEASEREI